MRCIHPSTILGVRVRLKNADSKGVEPVPIPIQYFNRHTRRIETESVYGEGFVRWTYGTFPGRLTLHAFASKSFFSRWYGWRMDRPASRRKVLPFIARYGLDSTEFADAPDSYRTFNEFFFRKLRPGARPVESDPFTAVFPADGRHLGFQNLSLTDGFLVKGEKFSLYEFLRDHGLASRYEKGAMVLSRLCPVDYHRFHFPAGGMPTVSRVINGPLYSVNPVALKWNIEIFSRNKRAITMIESPDFGCVTMVEVGATCVGSIVQTYNAGSPVVKGDEKGYFRFGGSSTVTLFEPGRIKLAPDLLEQSSLGVELYAKVGEFMGAK